LDVSITLATNTTDDVFGLQTQDGSTVRFQDASHNASAEHPAYLQFRRTEPKPSGNEPGVTRYEAKIFGAVEIGSSSGIFKTPVATVSMSFPVGMTAAQKTVFINRLTDLSAHASWITTMLANDALPYGA
jgi:hypothetical protein